MAAIKGNGLRILLRRILPKRLRDYLRKLYRRGWFTGHYDDWGSARKASAGYDDEAVLDKVVAATRAVVAGQALWERDGAVFTKPAVNAPLLMVLFQIAQAESGRLELVDFGGALGSTWRQHRNAFADLKSVRWCVVEQPHYVNAGREFTNATLDFYLNLSDAQAENAISTVLLSSVLQYLEYPEELLSEIVNAGIRHIVIDRTSFASDGRERIVVQRTPSELGGGSYPCRLFHRDALLAQLTDKYRLVVEWPGFDDLDPNAYFRGFHFELKSSTPERLDLSWGGNLE